MDKLARYFRTLVNLRAVQCVYLIWYRMRRRTARDFSRTTVSFQECDADFARLAREFAFDGEGASFFGSRRKVDFQDHWSVDEEALWLYNLHYFDDLFFKGAESYLEKYDNLIASWISANTDCSAIGWDPYPVSRRIVNWCKYLWGHDGVPPNEVVLRSLLEQADYLSRRLEYHLMANHLFANAKALVFVGILLGGREELLRKGIKLLRRELKEQFLEDGGHFERSPMYHNLMLWDVLDLLALARSDAGRALEPCLEDLKRIASAGIEYAAHVSHGDAQVSFFNDASFGSAPEIDELAEYAESLGLNVGKPGMELWVERGVHVTDLEQSGFTIAQSSMYKAIMNTGGISPPYQPGHAHADTLSFELSVGTARVFVNCGTSTYDTGKDRDFERSTRAHNTVELSDLNSSEVWGGFRVAQRAQVTDRRITESSGTIEVNCCHDGYLRRATNATHCRRWIFLPHQLEVIDKVSGTVTTGVARYYLHPSVELKHADEGIALVSSRFRLHISLLGGEATVGRYSWRPAMRSKLEANVLEIPFKSELRALITVAVTG